MDTDTAQVDRKRKATDPKLEILTIDATYDLTLVVGVPEHHKGQKAFRVNRGSLRSVSPVWAKMLSGDWAESAKSELEFPDDSCDAFLLVLRIAHFQISELPESLSRDELLDLAKLTDKYCLEQAVRVGLEMKKWMVPYRKAWYQWPAITHLQDFAV